MCSAGPTAAPEHSKEENGQEEQHTQKKRKLQAGAAAVPAAAATAAVAKAAAGDDGERDNQPSQKKQKGHVGLEVEHQTATVSGIMSSQVRPLGGGSTPFRGCPKANSCIPPPLLQTFDQLDLAESTKRSIQELGFVNMTEVQARTIPQLLVGRDVLGAAKTGVGSPGVWHVERLHLM